VKKGWKQGHQGKGCGLSGVCARQGRILAERSLGEQEEDRGSAHLSFEFRLTNSPPLHSPLGAQR
jgi:hypothetical protein